VCGAVLTERQRWPCKLKPSAAIKAQGVLLTEALVVAVEPSGMATG